MGKIRRERQKFHITATCGEQNIQQDKTHTNKISPIHLDHVENVFAGINIQFDFSSDPSNEPTKNVEEAVIIPTKPEIINIENGSNVSEKHLTKKDKMKHRREKLMQKLDVTQKARQQIKQNKGKKQTVRVPMLTPAATKPIIPSTHNDVRKVTQNIFSIPSFKDDLPALESVFKLQSFQNKLVPHKIASTSKSISKNSNGKKHFVNNYKFLKKAMTKKINGKK